MTTIIAKIATLFLVDHNSPFCYNIGIVTNKEPKMKLLITTQVYENYAWNEDGSIGKGDDAYWKAKGGSDYVIRNFDPTRYAPGIVVELVRPKVESDNDYVREHIVDWSVVEDDYLTDFERDQLEYEGKITFPARELELA
jgi:hypothetical protein